MKIAFVGKGGSGKTTLAALFSAALHQNGHQVLVLDADINQHLATALGATEQEAAELPTLGAHLPMIKEYLAGANPRIASPSAMIKTTPPGAGSRLLRVVEDNPIYDACVREVSGIRMAVTGPFSAEDLGVACYHSKVGAVELLLNHLVDTGDEAVVVDMTAGADSFASGLFTRFDMTFLVCEPTLRSVGVYRQYRDYAAEFGVQIAVVGNKIEAEDDLDFLREHVGEDLITTITRSAHVRAAERGDVRPIAQLEEPNLAALRQLREAAAAVPKDWAAYQRDAVHFHLRNASAWANDRAGADLAYQVDPDFQLGPAALAESGRHPLAVS